jgi:hypothetical protein
MHNSQLLTVRLFFDSEWANFTGLHISKNESDIVWLAIGDKLKWPHRNKNWYKTILNSTQNKYKVYHKTNLNNNIKLSSVKKSRTVSSWELCIRIILQSMFVNQQMVKRNSNGRIVIKSSDTDVYCFLSTSTPKWPVSTSFGFKRVA